MNVLSHRIKILGAVLTLLLVAGACGQKPEVYKEGAALAGGLAPGTIDPETGGIVTEDGTIIDPETGEVIAGPGATGGSSGTTTTTTSGSGDQTGTGGGDDELPQSEGEEPSGGTATGVSSSGIKIGIHAPITGAAPVPSSSFERGKQLYFNYQKSQGQSVNGRDVTVVSRNDNYNPSQAVAVCKEMVEQEKVFLLFGVAGTDQIQACARYASTVGVPYLSGGVTEIGLDTLRNYFAMWMSYKQQGPLLADFYASKLGAKGEKNGMVRFNAPTFQDAHDAFFSGMQQQGASVEYDRTVSKNATAADAQTVATEICRPPEVENIFPLTSPTWFLQLANQATCRPQYAGMGLTMGLDTVASVGCRNNNSVDDAYFLSPFPAFIDSNQFDPNFRKAGGADDIEWGLWGSAKVIWEMLLKPGKDLTRERFIYFGERSGTIKTGVLPDLKFSTSSHFGGSAMHLIQADCSQNRYKTIQSFRSSF